MRCSKLMAVLLIVGFFIHMMAVPAAPISTSSVISTPRETSAGRASLPAVSQESESIDSFNVHPENRWSEGTSGTFAEDLENGEFSIESFENTSSSNLRYRDAETTSGDIESRFRINASDSDAGPANGSDIESVLTGFNVTTDEGSGNSSLNAYYWNLTHYILRPTFTTSDGSLWRSWNIESDYQDYLQNQGEHGADGIDFIEETLEGGVSSSGATLVSEIGVLNISRNIGDSIFGIAWDITDTATAVQYDFLKVKLKGGGPTENNIRFRVSTTAGTTDVTVVAGALADTWAEYTVNLSAVSTWANINDTNLLLSISLFSASQATGGIVYCDYLQISSNNDSSDLTFFEYETYYRAQSKYDLMESTLNWKISDDADNKLVSTVQGQFKIEDFFPTDELIRDISLGTVGAIDYFFGLRSAGANATCWWDFYAADFTEFTWVETSKIGLWLSTSVFSSYSQAVGGPPAIATAIYELIVPDFDAMAGKFVINEISGISDLSSIRLQVFSVTAETGALVEEFRLWIEGGDGQALAASAGWGHRVKPRVDGVVQTTYSTGGITNQTSETSFSLLYNKLEQTMSIQLSMEDNTSIPRDLGLTATVASAGNEFLFRLNYTTDVQAAEFAETTFLLENWDLTFRDIFSGILLPLIPIATDVGILPSDPLSILVQAFRDLATIAQDSLEVSGQILTNIISIAGSLVIVAANSVLMTASLITLVSQTADILLDLDNIITNTAGLVADFTSLLADTAALVADTTALLADMTSLLADTATMITHLGDIAAGVADLPADFIDLLADTGDLLTTAGEIFDELVNALGDSWLGEIFDVLFALVSDLVLEIIAEALAIMTSVLDAMISYFRDITVSGVSIGDLIDFIDSWMVNFWNIADSIISLGTEILTVWTQVFLMGLLGIILIWAAATAKQDGALFTEKFTAAMNYNVNPVGFILTLRIPLGVILLGNLFWVVFTAYDWEGFLIPSVIIANFHYGTLAAYEIPDISDQWDIFFDYTTSVLEDILDTLLDEVAGAAWKTLVTLLSDDILGASPEIIVFVVTAGIAATILIRGRF